MVPLCPQKGEMEQDAQEKIEDAKHDIDEAVHSPVSSFVVINVYQPKIGAYIKKLPASRAASEASACFDERIRKCVSVFPL